MAIPTTMKAALLSAIDRIDVISRPVPDPGPGQVLIRVRAVSICGSDVHLFATGVSGPYRLEEPLVLGHEVSGVIAAVGPDVDPDRVGQRVALEPLIDDPYSPQSRHGRYNLDPDLEFFATPPVDGALAEYVVLPQHLAHPVPDSISDAAAALLEPLSVCIHAARASGVQAGDRVLIAGAGPIGVILARTLRAFGASHITVTDLDPDRRIRALELGADDAVDPTDAATMTSVRGVDRFLDASGAAPAIVDGIARVRPGGSVTLIGLGAEEATIPIGLIRDRELIVTGINRYANTWPTAITLVSSGQVELDSLVTARYPLAQTEHAFRAAQDPASIKVIIDVTPADEGPVA